MITFKELSIGDMFNTMSGRWVKISDTEAICVMSSLFDIGSAKVFRSEWSDMVILYRAK